MSTIGAVIERVNRDFLYPPDARPAQAYLNGAILAADTTLILTTFVVPEDEELLTAGALLELDQELVQVTAYDDVTLTATVKRGVLGTTGADHADETPVYLAPPYTRLSIYEAIADNIITLYPKLFTVRTEHTSTVNGIIAPIDDTLAVSVLEASVDAFVDDSEVDARIVDFSAAVGSRAVVFNVPVSTAYVKYKRRFGTPTDEDTTLVSLGVDPRWVRIVTVGAAADLMSGRDIPASHTDWIAQAIEAEQIPVGTRSGISLKLASYRNFLLEEAEKEMKAEYRGKIHQRRPGRVVMRNPY